MQKPVRKAGSRTGRVFPEHMASSNMDLASPARKLRLLALHSFRTSAKIFQEQMGLSGLDEKLADTCDFVYIDAPHAATGPPPSDVSPFFNPPYREWWNATEDPQSGQMTYQGVEETLAFISKTVSEQGPFDGCWAFSQGTMLATIIMSLQRQGKLLQDAPLLRFAVFFGGFHNKRRLKHNRFARQVFREGEKLDIPSVHVIGDKDSIRKLSHELMDEYEDALLITHPRGHTIPALHGHEIQQLEGFLKAQLESLRGSEDGSASDSKL